MHIFKAIFPLLVLLLIPFILVKDSKRPEIHDEIANKIVIVTPHQESIRYEFKRAFEEFYFKKHGREIVVEWHTPGGTSDIVRYVNDKFKYSFNKYWELRSDLPEWNDTIASAFDNRRIDPDDPSVDSESKLAKSVFLESNVGIDVDLFFGGGQYEMYKQAQMGHAIDAGLIDKHPEWFNESVIPYSFSGETFYDKDGLYYGTCLASFGICYNTESLAALKDSSIPNTWASLGEPRFFNKIVLADPTKSGSITKCFEMMVQQQMFANTSQNGDRGLAVSKGWRDGLNLIKRLGGNARYITNAAGKVPSDIGKGNATAGLSIDFYGRSESEWIASHSGCERLKYITPLGGSSMSADPILLFRGAPNKEAAIEFIEFVLSKEGQRIWNYRVGTKDGPQKYALRRLSVRKDLYSEADLAKMSDPDALPFVQKQKFTYDGRLTGRYFGLLRVLIKCMVVDSENELKLAWRRIVEAGGPAAVPEAMEEFNKLPFEYSGCPDAAASLNQSAAGSSKLSHVRLIREWTDFFRAQYKRAAEKAISGGQK